MTLRERKIILKQLVGLQATLDSIWVGLDADPSLTRSLSRVSIIISGWSAELSLLIEDFSKEVGEEEVRARMMKVEADIPQPPSEFPMNLQRNPFRKRKGHPPDDIKSKEDDTEDLEGMI